MRRLYFLTPLFFLTFHCCFAQVDTEFWFAAPEVSSGHGDRPIYLRISTLDQSANVRVVQPARGNLELANHNIAANTTQTINLSSNINNLETSIPATVMQTGIRIISSAPVTAYYEVGAAWNADIFALKGKNALGNKFVIPAQNFYNNSNDYSPLPYSSFDIVATKNNTVIRIKPTKPVYGHGGESEITVKLNAGETYSFRKVSQLASDNPAGTIVESNRPIAITIKDDSVVNGGCRDLLGDQLVPVKVAGLEYVVTKGFLDTDEFVFVTAIEDGTEVFIGGNESPSATLDAGGVFRYRITAQSTYILSNKTIYVFHVTGFGCELGMAILPSINCKGSQQIGFSRTTSEFFGLNILVRKEGIGSFKVNGSTSLIPASAFSRVSGTDDRWYAAQLSFSTTQIPVGQGSLISNDEYSFQVGIINGNASSTCRYGYFSAFSTLFIGDDFNICEGETATIDAGPGKETYLWNTGATTQEIDISDPGEYWVRIEKEECMLYDTVNVELKTGSVELGSDASVCEGDTAKIDGKNNFSWSWSDGSAGRYLEATEPGKYWVSVFDNNGCAASDTVNVILKSGPTLDLGDDIVKCPTEEIELDATFPGATYLWEDGSTAPIRMVRDSGEYHCTVFFNGCTASDMLWIENLPGPPQDSIYGSPSVCPFVENVAYEVEETEAISYEWFATGGDIAFADGHQITINWKEANADALVKALVTDEQGCTSDTIAFPVRINAELIVEVPEGPDTLCFNKSDQIVYSTPMTAGSLYTWKIEGGMLLEGQGGSEILVDWEEGLNKLWIEESSSTIDTVCMGISPELNVFVYKDQADIILDYVSVDTTHQESIDLSWTILHPERVFNDSISLYKKAAGEPVWQLLQRIPANASSFTDGGNFTSNTSYEYYLNLSNLCEEELTTNVHTTILLTGEADTLNDMLSFQWNHYQGWDGGVESYELWRRLDNAPGFRMIAVVPRSENSWAAQIASEGFQHEYVIRARQKSGSAESWSNTIDFDFEHPVFVPNVFTPNGDEFNEYFHISKVELYKDSELIVMDRWGRKVYKAKGYQNNWDGEDLSNGVYYYVLNLNNNNKIIKGTVSILR